MTSPDDRASQDEPSNRRRSWTTKVWVRGVGALLLVILGALIEGGDLGDWWAKVRHEAEYVAEPVTPQQAGEAYLAALRSGSADDLLQLLHAPARENCSGQSLESALAERRARAAEQDWVPRPMVRSSTEQDDGTVNVRYGYDRGDAHAILSELILTDEQGVWRIVAHPCPEAFTVVQWLDAAAPTIDTTHQAVVQAIDSGATMDCFELRARAAFMKIQTPPTEDLRQAVAAWQNATMRLVDACADQHGESMLQGLDLEAESEAYVRAAEALAAALPEQAPVQAAG